jgi:hypothetical protein
MNRNTVSKIYIVIESMILLASEVAITSVDVTIWHCFCHSLRINNDILVKLLLNARKLFRKFGIYFENCRFIHIIPDSINTI